MVNKRIQLKKEKAKKDREWREIIKKEFDSKCIVCNKTSPEVYRIHCHHLIPREVKELRFEKLNGVTLCPKHHKYSYDISAHKNSIAFINFYRNKYYERYLALLNKFGDTLNGNEN